MTSPKPSNPSERTKRLLLIWDGIIITVIGGFILYYLTTRYEGCNSKDKASTSDQRVIPPVTPDTSKQAQKGVTDTGKGLVLPGELARPDTTIVYDPPAQTDTVVVGPVQTARTLLDVHFAPIKAAGPSPVLADFILFTNGENSPPFLVNYLLDLLGKKGFTGSIDHRSNTYSGGLRGQYLGKVLIAYHARENAGNRPPGVFVNYTITVYDINSSKPVERIYDKVSADGNDSPERQRKIVAYITNYLKDHF